MSLVPSYTPELEEGTGFGILGLITSLAALILIWGCWCCCGGSKDTSSSKVVTLPSGLVVRYGGPHK